MCDGQKGFEGIEAVTASYLRLHPEVCVCICGCVCVSLAVSMALCMCVCVFVCVSYLAIEQLFGQSGGAASHLPHQLTSKDISSRSPTTQLLSWSGQLFFGSQAFIGDQQQKLGNEALIFILKTSALVLLARA